MDTEQLLCRTAFPGRRKQRKCSRRPGKAVLPVCLTANLFNQQTRKRGGGAKVDENPLATVENASCFPFRSRKVSIRYLMDFKTQIELDRELLRKLTRNTALILLSALRLI